MFILRYVFNDGISFNFFIIWLFNKTCRFGTVSVYVIITA